MAHPFESLRCTGGSLWETRTYFRIFDCAAVLSGLAEAAGPEPWQRELYDSFVAAETSIKDAVYTSILRYYNSVAEDYRSRLGEIVVPRVETIQDIGRLLTPDAVYIRDIYPERQEVGLLFECTWEEEHGLGVRLENGVIADVGFQDVCL